jgi:hypothetical protein
VAEVKSDSELTEHEAEPEVNVTAVHSVTD